MIRVVRPLLNYQEEAVQFAMGRTHFALFMEMRLGKTLTTIRIMQKKARSGPILVIAPQTTLYAWEKELDLEGEVFTSAYLARGRDQRFQVASDAYEKNDGRRHWILLHYEGLRVCPGLAFLEDWEGVVLDESPRIKNPTTQITKLCCLGFRTAKCRIILSGSPTPEGLCDIYPQMQFLLGEFMGKPTFWGWRASFFYGDDWGKWTPKPTVAKKIHDAVALHAFARRRVDVNVGSRKVYETRLLNLTKEQQKIYNQTESRFMTEYGNTTQWAIVIQTWLARMAGGFSPEKLPFHNHKFGELFSLLTGELSQDKVVVWFKFNHELMECKKIADGLGIPSFAIYGDTPVPTRSQYLRDFSGSKYRIAFLQTMCGKYGIDASAADAVIYYSNAYSGDARTQSEDRSIHPLKTTPQLVIDLAMKKTVDEDVLEALSWKLTNATAFMMSIKSRIERRTGIH